MHTVILPVQEDYFAVPISWVREVLAHPAATNLATAPAVVLGLINVRGDIVPLLDTAVLLGIGRLETVTFAAVLNTTAGPVALAASGLPERAEFGSPSGPSQLPGTAGIFTWGERVAVLLEPATLLTAEFIGGHDIRHGLSLIGSG